jgi:hypothetical protein
MTTARKITLLRIILSRLFFLCWFCRRGDGAPRAPILAALIAIFMSWNSPIWWMYAGARLGQVSDWETAGPLRHSVSRLTYFTLLTAYGL